MIDILAERYETALTLEDISDLQQRKTGALFDFAALSGPILASAEKPQRLALWGYAKNIGLAFQIADDLLDIEGDARQLGKPIGQDAAAGKATFVSDLGAENAREWQRRLVDDACARLGVFQGNARLLHDLAHFVVERRS